MALQNATIWEVNLAAFKTLKPKCLHATFYDIISKIEKKIPELAE